MYQQVRNTCFFIFFFYDAEIYVYRHAAAKTLPQKTHLKFSVLEYCMN